MEFTAKHGVVLLEQLGKMRETEHLTDVVLVAEGVSFPCHRLVLSAFSPYFRAMFTCGLRECNDREIILRDTPADSLALLLNYMYSSDLPLTNTNVQGISIAAFLLQMDDVFAQCQQHMTENMDASNCLGVFYFARDLGAAELAERAQRFLRQHFVQVCQNEEVVDLEAHQLGKLIGSDDLNISREETILDVVLHWAKHNVSVEGEVRRKHLPELLRKVRLPLINPDYLKETMKRNTALLADSECLEIMRHALDVVEMHPSAAPRKLKLRYGMETTDLLLCLGNDGGGIRSRYGNYGERSFCYAPATGRTYYITSPRYGEALGYVCAGVVTEDNNVIVSGEAGARRMSRQKEMDVELYRYKVEAQGSWERLTSAEYRDSYGLGSLGDTLYLIGGLMKMKNQLLITNCVERWSLQGGPWRSAAPLPMPLAYHSVVRMKDRLYVIGGRTPQSYRMDDEPDRLSNRLLEYDPNLNQWTELGPMKYSKYRCSAVVLNGEIFVMGGIGCEGADRGQSRHCLDAVEIYNPDGDYWRDGPSLPCSQLSLRTNAANAGVVGGKIYVCGFYKGAGKITFTVHVLAVSERYQDWCPKRYISNVNDETMSFPLHCGPNDQPAGLQRDPKVSALFSARGETTVVTGQLVAASPSQHAEKNIIVQGQLPDSLAPCDLHHFPDIKKVITGTCSQYVDDIKMQKDPGRILPGVHGREGWQSDFRGISSKGKTCNMDRHDDITKDILELDAWENRWTVVARRALMHDNYDVCLVASLNPRGLLPPPADLLQ